MRWTIKFFDRFIDPVACPERQHRCYCEWAPQPMGGVNWILNSSVSHFLLVNSLLTIGQVLFLIVFVLLTQWHRKICLAHLTSHSFIPIVGSGSILIYGLCNWKPTLWSIGSPERKSYTSSCGRVPRGSALSPKGMACMFQIAGSAPMFRWFRQTWSLSVHSPFSHSTVAGPLSQIPSMPHSHATPFRLP